MRGQKITFRSNFPKTAPAWLSGCLGLLRYEFQASNPIGAENYVLVEFPEIDPAADFWLPRPWEIGTRSQQPHGDQKSRFGRISQNRPNRWFLVAHAVGIRIRSQEAYQGKSLCFGRISRNRPNCQILACTGPGDKNSSPANPSGPKIKFGSYFFESGNLPVSGCRCREDTNSKPANPMRAENHVFGRMSRNQANRGFLVALAAEIGIRSQQAHGGRKSRFGRIS